MLTFCDVYLYGIDYMEADKTSKGGPTKTNNRPQEITMNKSHLLVVVSAFTIALLATSAQAALIAPTGLNIGDSYHVIFASSTTRDAASSNIADYDAHVQAAADTAGIGATAGVNWLALGSTTTIDAINHLSPIFTDPNTVPIYNQNGELVASSLNDLFNNSTALSAPVGYDENGTPISNKVWTGTFHTGAAYTSFTLGASNVIYGDAHLLSSWVVNTSAPNNNMYSLYGVSQEIIVGAVPAPAAAWLFGSGLLGLAGMARRKQQGAIVDSLTP
jgi:hypothetical protein